MDTRLAERLGEALLEWVESVEEGNHDNFYDTHLVDDLLQMHEILYKNGVEEGAKLQSYSLISDHPITLFETIEMDRFLSGKKEKIQILSILSIKPKEKQFIIEFLGKVVS